VCGYACSPRSALAKGDEATRASLGETGDVMTHPDWRKKGLFSALDRACMEETKRLGWPAVFGLPNRRSAHIFLELGWKKVGTVRPWTFLLRDDDGSREVRTREGRLQGWLVPLGVRKGKAARAKLAERAGGCFQARALDRFPAEVEALSRAVEKRFALMVRRDAAWLSWRFLQSPSGLHRAFGLFDDGRPGGVRGRPAAARGNRSAGLDVPARDDDARRVVSAARARAAGAAVVQAHAVDGLVVVRAPRRRAPPPKPQPPDRDARQNDPAHPVAAAALDARAWYLTDGDRDDETVG
jgi:hypothetical protein